MKLLIVADGIAEDCSEEQKTSLEYADTPFFDYLLQKSYSGMFDPRYSQTGDVKTDLVIGSILNIVPDNWPGRAYFEFFDKFASFSGLSGCAILRVKFASSTPLAEQGDILSKVSLYMEDKDFRLFLRSYERNQSSFLVWLSESLNSLDVAESFSNLVESLVFDFDEIRFVELADLWSGEPVHIKRFELEPCFIANAIGSLTGLCRSAGFDAILEAGHPLEFEHQQTTMVQAKDYILQGKYKFGVLYFKAPDWASHQGQQKLKIQIIEYIDNLLAETLRELYDSGDLDILLISDHRTNIGEASASKSTSIFLRTPFNRGNRVVGKYCERTIEDGFAEQILSLHELGSFFLDEK
jgi:hypothetical protein